MSRLYVCDKCRPEAYVTWTFPYPKRSVHIWTWSQQVTMPKDMSTVLSLLQKAEKDSEIISIVGENKEVINQNKSYFVDFFFGKIDNEAIALSVKTFFPVLEFKKFRTFNLLPYILKQDTNEHFLLCYKQVNVLLFLLIFLSLVPYSLAWNMTETSQHIMW